MSEPINIHEAKTQLSKLLSRVALGKEFTVANRGVPVARLAPYALPCRYNYPSIQTTQESGNKLQS